MIERVVWRWGVLLALATTGAVCMPPPASAGYDGAREQAGEHDHDRAQQARERGEIRPLEEVLPVVRQRYPGEVAKVALERDDGRWIYEVKVIDHAGRLLEIKVDARTAEIIEVEGR